MSSDLAQIENLLRQLLQPNTDVVQQAGNTVNKLLKQSSTVPLLLEVALKSQFPEIRTLAAVLARKKIIGHWGKLSKEFHENTKKALLQSLVNDPDLSVRRNIASLISVIARALIPIGEWKELLEFLFQCTQSPSADHREIATSLFNSLTETIGDHLRPHFGVLTKIFQQGLQDKEGKVRVASLKAVGSLVQWIESEKELAVFRELLPLICESIGFCIMNDYEEEAMHSFEIFDDLIEMPNMHIGALVPDLVKFVLSVGGNPQVDLNIRQRALTVIQWVVTFKSKVVVKQKLLEPILLVVLPLCADPSEEQSDIEELTNHKFASQMIDMIANNLPPAVTFKPFAEYIQKLAQSGNWADRRGAVIALGVIAEGCHEPMRSEDTLPGLLNFVYAALKDSNQSVREAGCIALGQFSKYLQPEIIGHYQTVLPFLFESLNDPTQEVRLGSCYAIEAFCENLGEEILPYLQPLMEKLIDLLRNGDKEIQQLAISAISSTAVAAKASFAPYFNVMMPLILQMMQITNEDDLVMRYRATECAGLIATSVGREQFQPVLKEVTDNALQGMAIESNELREYTYGLFANLAEILKVDFQDYLPIVVPLALASCESTDGISGLEADVNDTIEGVESDEEENEISGLQIRTAFLDEKAAAVHALGAFAEHVGAPFLPYIDRIMQTFKELAHYFHEDVRQGIVISLKQFVMCVNAAFPSGPWHKGVPEKEQPLHNNMRQFLDIVIEMYLATISTDEDKPTVGSAIECTSNIVKLLGPASIERHLPMIGTQIVSILQKKSQCQTVHEEEPEDEEYVEEQEMILIENTCDFCVEIAKVYGPLIDPYFPTIANCLLKYTTHQESDSYRSLAVGALAEMCAAFGFSVANYIQTIAPAALKCMEDSDAEVRSNGTYCWAVIVSNCSVSAYPFYPEALKKLAVLFNDNSIPNLLDNAASAAARMMLAGPTLVPMDQLMPAFLRLLPLRKDFQENEPVYKCIFELIKSSNAAIAGHMGTVLSIFAKALGSNDVQPEIQQEMVHIGKALLQQFGSQLQTSINSLPQTEQQNLQKYLVS